MSQWTYKTDEGLYDVQLLSDEAKVAFSYLAEVEAELNSLGKRADVLRAAASVYHKAIQDALTNDALVPEEENEESGGE
jgi:hypothetical protein